jgi:flagellar biosynthesis GTPase FlhF
MKVKKFRAPDRSTALLQIRAELGPDAVILQEQAVRRGPPVLWRLLGRREIELLAAVEEGSAGNGRPSAPAAALQAALAARAGAGRSPATNGRAAALADGLNGLPSPEGAGHLAAILEHLRQSGASIPPELVSALAEMIVRAVDGNPNLLRQLGLDVPAAPDAGGGQTSPPAASRPRRGEGEGSPHPRPLSRTRERGDEGQGEWTSPPSAGAAPHPCPTPPHRAAWPRRPFSDTERGDEGQGEWRSSWAAGDEADDEVGQEAGAARLCRTYSEAPRAEAGGSKEGGDGLAPSGAGEDALARGAAAAGEGGDELAPGGGAAAAPLYGMAAPGSVVGVLLRPAGGGGQQPTEEADSDAGGEVAGGEHHGGFLMEAGNEEPPSLRAIYAHLIEQEVEPSLALELAGSLAEQVGPDEDPGIEGLWQRLLAMLEERLLAQDLELGPAAGSTFEAEGEAVGGLEPGGRREEEGDRGLGPGGDTAEEAAGDLDGQEAGEGPAGGGAVVTGRRGPHVVVLVGPTGAGKTTTIAKLAAQLALYERRQVGLITADTFRIGAVSQLATYAEIMGLPLTVAYEPQDLADAVARQGEAAVLLVDTPGCGPRDRARLEELGCLVAAATGAAAQVTVLLAASAMTKPRDLWAILEGFGTFPLHGLVLTKVDETAVFGPFLSVVSRARKPVFFLTTGQGVPGHLERATTQRLARLLGERCAQELEGAQAEGAQAERAQVEGVQLEGAQG